MKPIADAAVAVIDNENGAVSFWPSVWPPKVADEYAVSRRAGEIEFASAE